MLKPAAFYKDEIQKKSSELFYTMDYFYYIGDLECFPIDVADSPDRGLYQFGSVDSNGSLVGYMGYRVDFYNETAYNFGLLSFDKGNMTVMKDLNTMLTNLLNNPAIKRIEYRCIGGNPIEHSYERFCKAHGGQKHTLHRVVRDMNGDFHDEEIFEILK